MDLGERLEKFHADFAQFKCDREAVSLSALQAEADWFADAYLTALSFPRHPQDWEGNEQLDRKIAAILAEERRPGGLVDRYRAALLDRQDWDEFLDLVWRRYDRLEREAFMPYWNRHCHWTGPAGERRIYNDIFQKYWCPRDRGGEARGYWAGKGRDDSRFPPGVGEDPLSVRKDEDMDIEQNIARFEAEMGRVHRPGVDKLLAYIRKSDFYTAPASTKYHLSCEGGLLQHSLNVLDALEAMLACEGDKWSYRVAGKAVCTIPDESVVIIALLHDICKTYFYATSTRNVKNEQTGQWEKVPFYTISDRMPLGHGAKSAMIVKQYMELTTPELYAIWHHMGFNGHFENDTAVGQSIEMHPIVLALHTADMMASRIMEADRDNKPAFLPVKAPAPESAGGWGDGLAIEAPDIQEET